MARRHLAVALLLTGRVAVEVDALRRATGEPDVERIPPHITLVPPANVRNADLDGVLRTLGEAATDAAAITVGLGPVTTFLPESPTLHLAVDGAWDALDRLRRALLVGPFDRPPAHPFVPHVTLRNPAPPDAVEQAREVLAAFRATATFDGVDLLQERERVWRSIADAPFGSARSVVGRGSLPLELTESTHLDPVAAAFAAREWEVHDDETYGPGTRWHRDPFALTARRDDVVVGVATGWTGLGVGYLSELVVARAVRAEGIGSHLLARVEALVRDRGCATLALRTEARSRAAAFYEARGWSVEATFPRWLAGRDFVQLRRAL